MMRPPIITLSAGDVAYATEIGRERQRMAEVRNRKPRNGGPSDHDAALALHILGANAELAAKRWLDPIHWNELAEKVSGLPDLGENIDVKAVRESLHRLLIDLDVVKAGWVYLLARGHNAPTWRFDGWVDGAAALAHREWIDAPQPGRPCYVVPNEALETVSEVWDYVERWFPADRRGA